MAVCQEQKPTVRSGQNIGITRSTVEAEEVRDSSAWTLVETK
jgi:hypothetical protein